MGGVQTKRGWYLYLFINKNKSYDCSTRFEDPILYVVGWYIPNKYVLKLVENY